MELHIRIAEAFLENPGGFLSILQVSKRLGLPYGTAYNRIHELSAMGVLQIIPQGKAKLCALNPDTPMTAALLGLGAAQATALYLSSGSFAAGLAAKIGALLETRLGDHLQSAILLNLEGFNLADSWGDALSESLPAVGGEPPAGGIKPLPTGFPEGFSLDLFFLTSREEPLDDQLDTPIQTLFPPGIQPRLTHMAVHPSTLVGMLNEKENEAGSSAYQMLRRGLILSGFERFFSLILRAFPPRIP